MVHIQIYGHIPFFLILGRGLFQCPPKFGSHFLYSAILNVMKNLTSVERSEKYIN